MIHKLVPLGSVVDYIRGITFKPTDIVEPTVANAVVCMRTKNIQKDLDESDLIAVDQVFVKRDEQYLREGDLLISSANSWELVGKTVYVPDLPYAATAGGFISIIRARVGKVDPRYLFHWIMSDRTQDLIRNCGRRTTNISNLSSQLFLKLEMPLPPLEEQKRIAAILDKADSLRRKRAQAIALADDFLRATFLDMFGDPVTNPKGWDLIDLGDLVEINPRIDRNKINISDEVVFLPMAAVAEQGYVAFEEYRPVVEVTKGFTYFERGDVLFAKITPCMENGKAAYLDSLSTDYGFGSTEFHVLRPGPRVNPWFLFHLIWNDNFRVKAEKSMKGAAGQKRVGADYLRSFKTHLPPKEIQDQFGLIVERVKQALSKSTYSLEGLEQLSKSLAASSFAQAV